MAELGIYEACKQGNHARWLVHTVYTDEIPRTNSYSQRDGIYSYEKRTASIGCARLACTCLCHHVPLAQDERGWTIPYDSYPSKYSDQLDVICREVAGFLEPDDAPLTFPEVPGTLES